MFIKIYKWIYVLKKKSGKSYVYMYKIREWEMYTE